MFKRKKERLTLGLHLRVERIIFPMPYFGMETNNHLIVKLSRNHTKSLYTSADIISLNGDNDFETVFRQKDFRTVASVTHIKADNELEEKFMKLKIFAHPGLPRDDAAMRRDRVLLASRLLPVHEIYRRFTGEPLSLKIDIPCSASVAGSIILSVQALELRGSRGVIITKSVPSSPRSHSSGITSPGGSSSSSGPTAATHANPSNIAAQHSGMGPRSPAGADTVTPPRPQLATREPMTVAMPPSTTIPISTSECGSAASSSSSSYSSGIGGIGPYPAQASNSNTVPIAGQPVYAPPANPYVTAPYGIGNAPMPYNNGAHYNGGGGSYNAGGSSSYGAGPYGSVGGQHNGGGGSSYNGGSGSSHNGGGGSSYNGGVGVGVSGAQYNDSNRIQQRTENTSQPISTNPRSLTNPVAGYLPQNTNTNLTRSKTPSSREMSGAGAPPTNPFVNWKTNPQRISSVERAPPVTNHNGLVGMNSAAGSAPPVGAYVGQAMPYSPNRTVGYSDRPNSPRRQVPESGHSLNGLSSHRSGGYGGGPIPASRPAPPAASHYASPSSADMRRYQLNRN